jgi:sugar/nucleoside kinase (ribokinase family)
VKALRDRGQSIVVNTLSGEGVLICDEGGCRVVLAFSVELVDTTVAGTGSAGRTP